MKYEYELCMIMHRRRRSIRREGHICKITINVYIENEKEDETSRCDRTDSMLKMNQPV